MGSLKRRLRRSIQREVDHQASGGFVQLGDSDITIPAGTERAALGLLEQVGNHAIAEISKAIAAGDDSTAIGARAVALADSATKCSNGPLLWQCKSGCNACCHDRVFITPPEALLIARGIRETNAEVLPKLMDELRAKADVLSDPTLRQGSIRTACLFLDQDDGSCVAYQVRPIACRSYTSFDAKSCRDHLDNPDVSVTQDFAALIGGSAVSAALRKAVTTAALDGEMYEMHAAVLAALLDPDAGDRWRRGERVFDGCLRLDALVETAS